MKKQILALFLAVGVLAGLLGGCREATPQNSTASSTNAPSSQAPQKAEIAVGIAQDLDDSLDPYQMTAAGTREVMFNVFEGLIKPDSQGNFVPAVAASYTVSTDGRAYTFPLREGVTFRNGKECTFEDVLYSFQTCAAVTVNSSVAAALSNVADIREEDGSVVITLTAPDPDFLSMAASVYIVPKDYDGQATAPVGTGPFRFVSRSIQENVILERFDGYYGAKPALERVTYRIFSDGNALFTALNSGALDLVAHLTVDQVESLTNGYQILEGTMNLVQAMYLNHAKAPFDNELVRQALCYAVDVDAMLALTADGHGAKVGSSMYPAFGKYFDPALADRYPHDAEKAKALLAQAGYADGFSFTLTVPSNYAPHVDTATVIVEQLKEVGVEAKLELVEWETWLSEVYAGRNFEATLVGFDASTLTASAMLARWVTGDGKNMIGYSNPDYDAAYAAARDPAPTEEEQTAYYRQCLEILSDTAANVYLQDLADFVAINPALTGYAFYPLYVMDMSTLSFQ